MTSPRTTSARVSRHAVSVRRLGRAGMIGALALALSGGLTGCGTVRDWFRSDKQKAAAPTALADFSSSATVTRAWSVNVGDGEGRLGIRQRPAVLDGRVYAAAVEGGVRAYDLQTGAEVWRHETEARVTGGPGAGEGLVVYGTLEGDVVALDAVTGEQKWVAEVKNEIIAPPTIGQGTVLVRSNEGRLTAFDVADGQRRWFWNRDLPNLSVRGNDGPTLGPGYVFVGNDDGSVAALALADGRPIWEQAVAQPDGRSELDRMADVDGAPVLDDFQPILYATSFKNQTVAFEAPSGRPIWEQDRGGSARIGVGADRIVVVDPLGTVWALDKAVGTAMWQQSGLLRRGVSGAAVQGDFAVVGDSEGYLHWLRMDNGDFAARERVGRDPIRAAPVVTDGVLLVQTADGKLSAYRLQ